MEPNSSDHLLRAKMRTAGVPEPTIAAFLAAVQKVRAGDRGLLPESVIEPIASLPRLVDLGEEAVAGKKDLRQLVVIKLNGGLGTGMGLDRTKSLIRVRGQDTFLDFTVRQLHRLRQSTGGQTPAFYLMNSFVTQQETLQFLRRYPDLAADGDLDFLQSRVPKLEPSSLEPITWPAQPELEWCPPGHGDFYPSILGCGLLERLLNRGIRYAFISNSDNLGASVDLKLFGYFAQAGLSFLMEVAERATADRKGGHLARRRDNGRLALRESAQCPKAEEDMFQDVQRHGFFNTNNLWLRLDHLKTDLEQNGGVLPLPLITNLKNVDPREPATPKVLQLESAMGAAIECFDRTGAIVVPRTRFAPVKATVDLLALRSDAYRVTDDDRLELVAARRGHPPCIELDPRYYKVLADFERLFFEGPPSLLQCDALTVSGPVQFAVGVVCQGKVEVTNRAVETKVLGAGTYRDCRLQL